MKTLLRSLSLVLLTSWSLAPLSCTVGGDEGEGEGEGEGECDVENVSDGPLVDSISAGATAIVCYYPQPSEGYCRKITSTTGIANFYAGGNDKGAIGCAGAVILTDAECPTANAIGRCEATNIEAERLYYSCSKFDDPAGNCDAVGGTYSAL